MATLRDGLRMPFRDFWRLYLDAHRRPGTRACHYVATLLGMAASVAAALTGNIFVAAGGIACAVALAVGSHRVIEHNKPLIAVNPFYGAVADVKMCWLALTGGLQREYVRLGLAPAEAPTAKRFVKQTTV
jgi:hypothetical protein